MAEILGKAKKRNFTEAEVETLVGEMEARKVVLFGGHGIGIINNKKQSECQHVAAAQKELCQWHGAHSPRIKKEVV